MFFPGKCKFNINTQLPKIPPLLFNAGSSNTLLPQSIDVVYVKLREKIRAICPGAGNSFSFEKSRQEISPHCVTDDVFSPGNGTVYPIAAMGCKKPAQATAVSVGECSNKHLNIQVGFNLTRGDFASTMNICFDQSNYDAVYTIFKLTPAIIGRQHNITRPEFNPSTFYGNIKVKDLYVRKNQRNTIAKLLGSQELAEKYIKDDNLYFLARGHLAAKADFVYGAEQRSTFFYMNAAPQWQIFNAGNWEKLETDVRNFAANRTSELIVITGIWGTSTLPDEKGKLIELYLYADENNNRGIRVPAYYWKVLYDPSTKEGAAFIGTNNPYLKEITDEHVFCTDICENFKWLTWDQHNIKRGYSFCCSMDEFRKVVTTVPDFNVTGIFKETGKFYRARENVGDWWKEEDTEGPN